jgi:methyl-accepting chemotaxis protein
VSNQTSLSDELARRLAGVTELTEREVLAAGQSVNDIVHHASEHIAWLRDVLGKMGSGDDAVTQTIAAQSEMVRDHVADMAARIIAHDEATQRAVDHVASTLSSAKVIATLTHQAKVLALNARIESARAGDQARGFTVIAEEMARLSKSVAETNHRVQQLASTLSDLLPLMAAQTRELRDRSERFAEQASSQIGTLDHHIAAMRDNIAATASGSDDAMAQVLRDSNTALSHMQFQDVAAARLRGVTTWVAEVTKGMMVEVQPEAPAAAADNSQSGELAFF